MILAVFLLAALVINLAVLELFDQNSTHRAAHSLIGIIMLMGFAYTFTAEETSRTRIIALFLIALIPCYLGTVFPDLDIRLLGIGSHRNPVFHSGMLFFLIVVLARRFKSFPAAAIISGFGLGIGAHLIWDLFDRADVRWIPGGTLDSIWLGVNGLLCILLARFYLASRVNRSGR